jgi:hypothetical protein
MHLMKQVFKKVTRRQCSEFGQVAVLICIFLALYLKDNHYITAAFWVLLFTILIPDIFYPFALLWFGLSTILSKISSFVILNVIFFLLVIPMGFFRKLLGKDALRLKKFKSGRNSVMIERNHLYEAVDLVNTF